MPELIFQGNPAQIKAQLLEFRNEFLLLKSKDIGQFVGYPMGDYLRRKPVPLSVIIHMSGNPKPLKRGRKPKGQENQQTNNPAQRAQIKILCPNRKFLTWQNIKNAVGGKNGYFWGPHRAYGRIMLDEGIGKLQCYAGSEQEARNLFYNCLALSEGEILSFEVKEEVFSGMKINGKYQEKKRTRVYPNYFTIVNQDQFIRNIERDRGRVHIDGNKYLVEDVKIPLYPEQEPIDAADRIRELLRRGD